MIKGKTIQSLKQIILPAIILPLFIFLRQTPACIVTTEKDQRKSAFICVLKFGCGYAALRSDTIDYR
jgi:hypothetical protein